MTIRYTQTPDDYVALLQMIQKQSPTMPWQEWLKASVIGLFAALQTAASFHRFLSLPWLLLLALSCGLSLVAFYFSAWVLGRRYFTPASIRSHYKANKQLLGQTELEISRDGIVQRRHNQTTVRRWDSIEDVIAASDHTLIVAKRATCIIPHTRLSAADYVSFMQELARQMEAYTLTSPQPLVDSGPPAVTLAQTVTQTAAGAMTLNQS